jgi:hypothetical protein
MRIKQVIVAVFLLLPIFLNAQSLDTVVVKQLYTGWNIVGFMGQTPEQTREAFAGIMDKVEMIKTFDGFYTPEQEDFLNSLDSLLPLDGVMIKVSEDCMLERIVKKSAILYHDAETDPIFSSWDKSSGISITESQISDFGNYIETETDPTIATLFDLADAAHGDLLRFDASVRGRAIWKKYTPTYISDYTVTEDDVTAHQSALIITESQISDLGNYIETETDPTVTKYSIGDLAQGGIVFWVDETGQHGLVAAEEDQDDGNGIQWSNQYSDGSDFVTNAVRDGIGAGLYNTERIIISHLVKSEGNENYAAQLCANYKGGGYGDWYLPSKYELNLLYLQKTAVGGFASAFYWSSTELDNYSPWIQDFVYGGQDNLSKNVTLKVRAVRAF